MVSILDFELSRLCLSYSQGFVFVISLYLFDVVVFYLFQVCGWYYILYYLLGKFDVYG